MSLGLGTEFANIVWENGVMEKCCEYETLLTEDSEVPDEDVTLLLVPQEAKIMFILSDLSFIDNNPQIVHPSGRVLKKTKQGSLSLRKDMLGKSLLLLKNKTKKDILKDCAM